MTARTETTQGSTRQRGSIHNSQLSAEIITHLRRHGIPATVVTVPAPARERYYGVFGGPDGVTSETGYGESDQVHLTSSFGGPDFA